MRLGVDIISISRFRGINKEDFKLWEKVFTESEWVYCFKDERCAQHLAGVFAAKEAAFKALNGGAISTLKDIEVRHKKNGLPILNIAGLFVSISHTEDTAVAVVIGL